MRNIEILLYSKSIIRKLLEVGVMLKYFDLKILRTIAGKYIWIKL